MKRFDATLTWKCSRSLTPSEFIYNLHDNLQFCFAGILYSIIVFRARSESSAVK